MLHHVDVPGFHHGEEGGRRRSRLAVGHQGRVAALADELTQIGVELRILRERLLEPVEADAGARGEGVLGAVEGAPVVGVHQDLGVGSGGLAQPCGITSTSRSSPAAVGIQRAPRPILILKLR